MGLSPDTPLAYLPVGYLVTTFPSAVAEALCVRGDRPTGEPFAERFGNDQAACRALRRGCMSALRAPRKRVWQQQQQQLRNS